MIFVPGTDVHWGDPVNTASKLGQDLARGGQVLLSSTVHEELLRAEPEAASREVELERPWASEAEGSGSPPSPGAEGRGYEP